LNSVAERSDEEVVTIKDVSSCELCGQVSCDWQTFGDNICAVCNDLKDSGMTNNQVWFQAYR
jgi:hypothetical protein